MPRNYQLKTSLFSDSNACYERILIILFHNGITVTLNELILSVFSIYVHVPPINWTSLAIRLFICLFVM